MSKLHLHRKHFLSLLLILGPLCSAQSYWESLTVKYGECTQYFNMSSNQTAIMFNQSFMAGTGCSSMEAPAMDSFFSGGTNARFTTIFSNIGTDDIYILSIFSPRTLWDAWASSCLRSWGAEYEPDLYLCRMKLTNMIIYFKVYTEKGSFAGFQNHLKDSKAFLLPGWSANTSIGNMLSNSQYSAVPYGSLYNRRSCSDYRTTIDNMTSFIHISETSVPSSTKKQYFSNLWLVAVFARPKFALDTYAFISSAETTYLPFSYDDQTCLLLPLRYSTLLPNSSYCQDGCYLSFMLFDGLNPIFFKTSDAFTTLVTTTDPDPGTNTDPDPVPETENGPVTGNPTSNYNTSTSESSSSNYIAWLIPLIIGVVIGVIILIFFVFCLKRMLSKPSQPPAPADPNNANARPDLPPNPPLGVLVVDLPGYSNAPVGSYMAPQQMGNLTRI